MTNYLQAMALKCARYLVLMIAAADLVAAAEPAGNPCAWPVISAQCRPWAYWWWLGSAVDKTNLTRELQRCRDAGLGGVHIIPIYGARGFESNYIPYLSPRWMEMMGWSVAEANRLGLGVDMTTGTGWCFGGPQVSDQDANASVVVTTCQVAAGEKLTQKFNPASTQVLIAFSAGAKAVDLTGRISAGGSVDWTAPNGSWTVYAISQKPSGQKVKRPAPGGEGWMLNPLYPPAMDDYLRSFTAAFANYSGPKPRAQYQDSYEYKSDWAPDFFAQFERRRGYDLRTELPALFGANHDDRAARVLCDYRETVSDLMAGEWLPRWVRWSHAHGFLTREEAHGSPGNLLDLYATADIPETEFFSRKHNPLVSKFASSAAHVTGKKLVASESCTWLAEHFTETLAEVKGVMDELFLSGVNHAFYHGCCYSPDAAGWPGWHFYAATEMNPRNPIWRDAPAVNQYIARVQSVLQSGTSDNDLLLYWPICDFWSRADPAPRAPQFQVEAASQQIWFESQPIGRSAKELWDRGYAFDYVSDAQLQVAKVAAGKIQLPGGKYPVIVVPECQYMPLETFKKLAALAEPGATVIFEKGLPADVPGENDLAKRRAELNRLKSRLVPLTIAGGGLDPRSPSFQGYRIGKGQFLISLESLVHDQEVAREPMVDADLSFVRRSFDGGWNYFIVNRTDKLFDGWMAPGHIAQSFVLLDPMTGTSGLPATRQNAAHSTEVHLQLAAGESVILRALARQKVEGPAWRYWQPNGPPFEIAGPWNVHFTLGGPTLPSDFQAAKLASWTTFPDTSAQAFAGTAKYETLFDTPDPAGKTFEINLGDVRQSARVHVNGKDYGPLVMAPFRVVVGGLKPAGNRLEVEVTSVAANRIRDLDRRGVPWKTFRDINFVDIDYKPFNAANWPLTDCGLLGPVTLSPLKPDP